MLLLWPLVVASTFAIVAVVEDLVAVAAVVAIAVAVVVVVGRLRHECNKHH